MEFLPQHLLYDSKCLIFVHQCLLRQGRLKKRTKHSLRFFVNLKLIEILKNLVTSFVKVILHILQNKKGGRRSSKIRLAIPILILEQKIYQSGSGFGFKLLS